MYTATYLSQITSLVSVTCLVLCVAQTVVLDSSVGTTRQACPGEMVTYTCTVRQGFLLEWIVEPFISRSDPVRLLLDTTPILSRLDCNNVTAVRCEDFDFVTTLTNTANPTVVSGTPLADMTSTLTFTATDSLNGTVVECRGSTASGFPINSSTFNLAGVFMLAIETWNLCSRDA